MFENFDYKLLIELTAILAPVVQNYIYNKKQKSHSSKNFKTEKIKFRGKTISLIDFFEKELNLEIGKIYDSKIIEKFDFEINKIEKERICSDIKEILKYRSVLIKGIQGSGKSQYIKKLAQHLHTKNNNYIISYIKSWDYDNDNNPLMLFIKKVLSSNVLENDDQDVLWCLMWLYNNELKSINLPNHILVDLTKDFFQTAKIKENKKLLMLIDELERCNPEFAAQLLEVLTTYTGVECKIDDHSCYWDIADNTLLINNIIVIYAFDKEFLTNSLASHYGQNDKFVKSPEKFWKKYIELEIKKDKISYSALYNILVDFGFAEQKLEEDEGQFSKGRVIDFGNLDLRSCKKVVSDLITQTNYKNLFQISNHNKYKGILFNGRVLIINYLICEFSKIDFEINYKMADFVGSTEQIKKAINNIQSTKNVKEFYNYLEIIVKNHKMIRITFSYWKHNF